MKTHTRSAFLQLPRIY